MKAQFHISPFQGFVSWRCHFIEHRPMLADVALLGEAPTVQPILGWGNALSDDNTELRSPEAIYANTGCSPVIKQKLWDNL